MPETFESRMLKIDASVFKSVPLCPTCMGRIGFVKCSVCGAVQTLSNINEDSQVKKVRESNVALAREMDEREAALRKELSEAKAALATRNSDVEKLREEGAQWRTWARSLSTAKVTGIRDLDVNNHAEMFAFAQEYVGLMIRHRDRRERRISLCANGTGDFECWRNDVLVAVAPERAAERWLQDGHDAALAPRVPAGEEKPDA